MTPTLVSTRTRLRPFELADGPAYLRLGSDPAIIRYTDNHGLTSLEDALALMARAPLHDYATSIYGRLAVEWRATGEVIGFCGLKYLPDLQEVDLGYRFLPEFWGLGLATETSQTVLDHYLRQGQTPRVMGLVHPANGASARVMTKLGFTEADELVLADLGAVAFRRFYRHLSP
ncbi:MAG: GNAT family N-acetyltransferase [Gammaproteobacteria bacterium]|nr:GNAT family N-acetyltransferase [Gammaproteobacteria bacterium]